MAQNLLNKDAIVRIMNKRALITKALVGRKVLLTIQGNGTVVDVLTKDGDPVMSITDPDVVLQKKIFNVRANSEVAMSNSRNKQILKDAIAAEKAGDEQAAHELYNDFLNKSQVSFGVILPSAIADKLGNGVDIAAKVELISTENGELLTIDPSTISVKEPEVLGATAFSLNAVFGEDEDEQAEELEPTPIPEKETAKQRKEREAYDRSRGVTPLVSAKL